MALINQPRINELTERIIGAAIEVHRHLGPGLLESVYLRCLTFELRVRGLSFTTGTKVPIRYKGMVLESDLLLDVVVEGTVVVEGKAVEQFAPVHRAQLLTYLRLTNLPAGLLINFNVPLLRDGVKRVLHTPKPGEERSGANQNNRNRRLPGRNGVEVI